MRKVSLLVFYLLVLGFICLAQNNDADERSRREAERRALVIHETKIKNENRDREKREAERRAVIAENKRILDSLRLPEPPTIEKPSINDNLLLEVSAELRLEFSEFDKDKKSGLFVLYPHPGCERFPSKFTVDTTCENNGFSINDGGSNYSFRDRKHVRGNWIDISWRNSKFVARGNALERNLILGYVQGIITDGGDVGIDTINVKSGIGKLIWDFVPAETLEGVKFVSKELGKGIVAGKYLLNESAELKENRTYILRSIPYRAKDGFYDYSDSEVDILVAFRTLRRLGDGKILIGWKEIKRRNSPKVTFKAGKEKVILK